MVLVAGHLRVTFIFCSQCQPVVQWCQRINIFYFPDTNPTSITAKPTATVTSTRNPEPCPPGWLSFSASCYQIHRSCAQTRHLAQNACQLLGGHLVTINTPQEEEFITSKLDKRKEWWISGSWADDTPHGDSSGDDDYLIMISPNVQSGKRYHLPTSPLRLTKY